MDINNVDSYLTLDPSQLMRAHRFVEQGLNMYDRDDELTESYLKEHLAGKTLEYAMHLLDETTTSYMGVQIHNQGGKFSAPTAGVYGASSRPELKSKIKEKVLKKNERENKAAKLRKEELELQEKKMSKAAHKKAAKAGKRWQDSDGDGKWYEPGEDVKKEEYVDEAMVSGARRDAMMSKAQSPRTTTRDKANIHNIAVRNDTGPSYEKKSTGGKGARYAGYGDQGAGNKARRRSGQEPIRGNTRREEVEVQESAEDRLRDQRMERGGVDGNTNYSRPAKTNATGPKKKPSGNSMSAFDKVVADLKAKHGDKSVMAKKTIRKEEVVLNVVEYFFAEMIDEGYHEDDIVEAFDIALTEATVTYGHDTEKPYQKNTSVRRLAKAVGRLAKRALKKKGSELKQKAQDTYKQKKSALKGKVRNVALKVADRMKEETEIAEGDYWHPDPKKDSQISGVGNKMRAREDGGASSVKKSDPKKLRPGESYYQYAKRQKASRNEEFVGPCPKCDQDPCECDLIEQFSLLKDYLFENELVTTEEEVIEIFETIDDAKLEEILESAVEMKGKKKGNVIINPTPKKVEEDADASKKMQLQRKQLALNKQKIALQQKATSKKTATDMHVEENLQEVDMTTRSVEFGAEIENTAVKRKKEKKALSDFKKLSMGRKTASEEVEQIGESEYRRMLAKERQSEREKESNRPGRKSITPGKSSSSTAKNYADSQIGSIKLHDKVTKKAKHTVGNPFPEEVDYEIEEGMKQARKNVGADKCWDGYEAKGTKIKDGRQVPNCVKK